MPINYQVKTGDCISSIAFEHGFFADTIWNHPSNAALKNMRQDPNTLCAGDVVFIPDKREKVLSKPTNELHRFRLHNTPALCSLQLFDENEYRANQSYDLEIDGVKYAGTTDANGVLRVSIPPNAKNGVLIIGPDRAEFKLQLGRVEPPTETRGVQARLNNLGFECPVSGQLDDETKRALRRFQRFCEIEETGEIDAATRQKLDDLHDNVCDLPEAKAETPTQSEPTLLEPEDETPDESEDETPDESKTKEIE